jgi:hypothetical protein
MFVGASLLAKGVREQARSYRGFRSNGLFGFKHLTRLVFRYFGLYVNVHNSVIIHLQDLWQSMNICAWQTHLTIYFVACNGIFLLAVCVIPPVNPTYTFNDQNREVMEWLVINSQKADRTQLVF